MIYGYTYKAPWIGCHTILYCKNVSMDIHKRIWREIYPSGGGYYISGFDPDSPYLTKEQAKKKIYKHLIQYGANDNIILDLINKFDIQVLAKITHLTKDIKQTQDKVLSEIDLAIKLESN